MHINALSSKELQDGVQHTKKRKPGLLKKIADEKGGFQACALQLFVWVFQNVEHKPGLQLLAYRFQATT